MSSWGAHWITAEERWWYMQLNWPKLLYSLVDGQPRTLEEQHYMAPGCLCAGTMPG